MAQLTRQQYPPGYDGAANGRSFFGNSADAGIAIIAPATGGGHPTLINYAGSGAYAMLKDIFLTRVSGTDAPVGLMLCGTTGIGSAAATGTPLLTATAATKQPSIAGSGYTGNPLIVWSPTVNTFTAAPTVPGMGLGISTFTVVTTAVIGAIQIQVPLGHLGVGLAPGNAWSLCAKGSTTSSLWQVTFHWDEIPTTS